MQNQDRLAELRRQLARAEDREQHLETDSSFEANRQVIYWLCAEIDLLTNRQSGGRAA